MKAHGRRSIVKGVILAGGKGTRLHPLTIFSSKQLLPVYDKPLIYYPLSTLMLAGIKDILVITAPDHAISFQTLLRDGGQFGISISYMEQAFPQGIAQGLILAEDFLKGEACAFILGDNIFHGPRLGRSLQNYTRVQGSQIFGYPVKNPENYGVAVFNDSEQLIQLQEKPTERISNIAIPGLYFFDSRAVNIAKSLKPSERGELEIVDVLKCYLNSNELSIELLPRGTAWFDAGTFADLHDAGSYVRLIEERTGERIGDPNEVSKIQGLVP